MLHLLIRKALADQGSIAEDAVAEFMDLVPAALASSIETAATLRLSILETLSVLAQHSGEAPAHSLTFYQCLGNTSTIPLIVESLASHNEDPRVESNAALKCLADIVHVKSEQVIKCCPACYFFVVFAEE